ncbi:MAG: 50S ribosomal protein L23 [Rickettsiales bacterium]|nr:50S ribosomal protein L23 [Rickettsiales bacterium]
MIVKNSVYDILQAPVLSEKSMKASEFNKYIFRVKPDVTKEQVKKAVEEIFGVKKIIKINSLNVEGKRKIFKGIKGKRKNYKKVIVTLEKGSNIDFNAGVK